MATAAPQSQLDATRKRIIEETPFWAEHLAKIVDKRGNTIPLVLKDGQLVLDEALEAQRAEGKPMRALSLKARQIGISTYSQAKLVHRGTLREHYDALTVAHDRETAAKLFRMAQVIYSKLPDEDGLKPELGEYRRGRFMHFAGTGDWKYGEVFPDSRYLVDTAGEFEAGRGGTYRAFHLSEIAFWPQIMQKLTALLQGISDEDPETLIIGESTANGFNEFKDLWDDAEEGRSEFFAHFWPWFKEAEYQRRFPSENEKEAFIVGDPNNPYADREPELIERFELSLEQLNWRRYTIANKCGGDIRIWDQEYPTVPEDAFIATGQKVFDSWATQQLLVRIDLSDPKHPTEENPGPQIGDFAVGSTSPQVDRSGNTIEVPDKALWVPREKGVHNPTAPFRLWVPEDEIAERQFIIGVDFSGGNTETTRETDYHALQVVDHRTREQVAEYRSRIEPEEFVRLVLLAALFFNEAWVVPERTGGFSGLIRILYRDFHYMRIYRARRGNVSEKLENRLGWDTTPRSKPELVAGMSALLKEAEDGIRSRALAGEVRTYTRNENGSTEAEPGKYDDLLMAYMIAQQGARERPLADLNDAPPERGFIAGSHNLASYDPRFQ